MEIHEKVTNPDAGVDGKDVAVLRNFCHNLTVVRDPDAVLTEVECEDGEIDGDQADRKVIDDATRARGTAWEIQEAQDQKHGHQGQGPHINVRCLGLRERQGDVHDQKQYRVSPRLEYL